MQKSDFSAFFLSGRLTSPASPTSSAIVPRLALSQLVFHRVVRFDGFGLDDDSRVASSEGAAFGGDGSGDIAGRQSECHGDSRGNGQRQVLDGFHEPLFLGFG